MSRRVSENILDYMDRSCLRFRVSDLLKQLTMIFRIATCVERTPMRSLASADSDFVMLASMKELRMGPLIVCVGHLPLLTIKRAPLKQFAFSAFDHDLLPLHLVVLPRPARAPVL